jgi:hypothetical protein
LCQQAHAGPAHEAARATPATAVNRGGAGNSTPLGQASGFHHAALCAAWAEPLPTRMTRWPS